MPHFGLLDENALGPVESELVRARLHIRAGRRLMAEGRVRDGLSALFDALLSSLRWHSLAQSGGGGLADERDICASLQRTGLIDPGFDYDRAYEVVEGLIDGRTQGSDYAALAGEMESVMESLGVIPFDYASLPPEKHAGEG